MERRAALKHIILVHGLWLNAWAMLPLKLRLRNAGFKVSVFGYHSVTQDLEANAADLSDWLLQLDQPVDGFVAHSLGGVTLRALFHYFPQEFSGRVVTLGTPHLDTIAGRRLREFALGRILIGRSIAQYLQGGVERWRAPPGSWGCIAGRLSAGVGRVVIRSSDGDNDGTVLVEEALPSFASDQKILRVSHFGLLTSSRVATETVSFLRQGRFLH